MMPHGWGTFNEPRSGEMFIAGASGLFVFFFELNEMLPHLAQFEEGHSKRAGSL